MLSKMKKYIVLFCIVSFLLLSCTAAHKKANDNVTKTGKQTLVPSSFYYLRHNYSSKEILMAIYSENNFSFRTIDPNINIEIDDLVPFLDSISTQEQTKLLDKFNGNLNLLSEANRDNILNVIESWCTAREVLGTLDTWKIGQLIDKNHILYNMPQTRFVFQKYLTGKNQYEGSLDVHQETMVSGEILNYISNLSTKEQLKFYSDFFNNAYKNIDTSITH